MGNGGQRGQVIPLIALCLTVLLGFGGLGVDVATWEYHQREQQSATDAAALGGAQQLIYSNCTNYSAATTAAQNDAGNGGFADGGNVTVTVQTPPQSGPYAGNACAVSVQITSANVASFLTRFFGQATGVSESTSAVASAALQNNGCIYMLGSGQNTNFNGSNVQAAPCSIYLNGSANFNSATVDAQYIGEANYTGSNNGGSFTGSSPKKMLPVADPCPEIAGCAYLAANPPSTSPCTGTYNGQGVLNPGCYSNLNLNGATVTLSQGLYTFTGSSNFNKASITGTGATIYVPAGASTNFNKVSSMTLTPPTSGNYTGVSYYQVPSNSNSINFNGSSTNISGLIYAPSASMNYNGSIGKYTILVAAYANLNGSTGEDFGAPGGGQSYLIRKAVLSE